MKLWTLLAGLAVAGILASSVFAADDAGGGGKKGGKGKRGAFTPPPAAADLKLATAGKVTQADLEAYYVSKLPADPAPTDDQKTAAKTQADRIWVRIAGAATPAVAADAAPTASLTTDQYTAARAAMPMMGGGGGKKGGGKKGGGGGGGA